jgi:alpha-glucosidase (family GH31 glycosyl hydrolase)
VILYRAPMDQFPVFGREGSALPLGRAVQHTGEIDAEQPLEQVWLFGKPARTQDGFAQFRVVAAGGAFAVHAADALRIERFGDAADTVVLPIDE